MNNEQMTPQPSPEQQLSAAFRQMREHAASQPSPGRMARDQRIVRDANTTDLLAIVERTDVATHIMDAARSELQARGYQR